MYYKHFSVALTFLLTSNDINKPIHGFITPNVVKEVVSLAYVKWVKVIFWYPRAAILDCFLPSIRKK